MDRREFLRLSALAGVALMTPLYRRRAEAATTPYGGPYFLMIHASGGWDPTFLCDPKGDPINRNYKSSAIGSAGAFRYAPIDFVDQFFKKYAGKLMVVNGIDTTTGNHDTGTRVVWSGRMDEGYPTLAALVAAARAPGNPLAFVSAGGYEATGNLVPLTRLDNVDAVRRLAFPNRLDPNNPAYKVHSDETAERIRSAQRARLEALRSGQTLPRLTRATAQLFAARGGDDALAQLAAKLPPRMEVDQTQNPLHRQALVALAGFQSGMVAAANLTVGGFDTHGDHDRAHAGPMSTLLQGIDRIQGEIAKRGLDGKVTLVVGSDFGRTPAYNPQNGKDHWNITSMLLMGAGIPGGRLVGATDDTFRAKTVHPMTLQPDASGTRIRCDHLQRALRRLAGIEDSAGSRAFPLGGVDLPLFA